LSQFILTLIKILLTFAGAIAVVMVVIGGYWYMAAGGNEELAEKGKNTILNFVIGLAIIIMAYTIVTIIASTLTGADKLVPS
jgi:type IV secretory pathway VirB2 component (pilin)